MKKELSYKAFFFSFIGIILLTGFLKCSAQIPKDKQAHLYIGAGIGAWSMTLPPQHGLKPVAYSFAISTTLGGAKELYNTTRGLPMSYVGTTSLSDKFQQEFNPGVGHLWFPKAIFFTVGIVIPLNEL